MLICRRGFPDRNLKLLGFKPIELRDLLEELYERWANLVEVRESHLAKLEATVVSLLKERNAMLPVELPRTVLQYLSDLGEHHPGIHVPHLLIDDYQMLDFAAQTLLGLLYSSSLTIAYDPLQSLLSIQPDAIPWELKELDEKTSDGKDPALQKSQVLDHKRLFSKKASTVHGISLALKMPSRFLELNVLSQREREGGSSQTATRF